MKQQQKQNKQQLQKTTTGQKETHKDKTKQNIKKRSIPFFRMSLPVSSSKSL